MAGRLPTVTISDKEYFIDDRLGELRNVNNPHDVKALTCRDCDVRPGCQYVNDPYNTQGACLLTK